MVLEAVFREQEMGADMESLARKEGCALLFLCNTEHVCTHCFHLETDRLIGIGYCSGGEEGGKDLDVFFFLSCLLSIGFIVQILCPSTVS